MERDKGDTREGNKMTEDKEGKKDVRQRRRKGMKA
jgi:hypothetical protein